MKSETILEFKHTADADDSQGIQDLKIYLRFLSTGLLYIIDTCLAVQIVLFVLFI